MSTRATTPHRTAETSPATSSHSGTDPKKRTPGNPGRDAWSQPGALVVQTKSGTRSLCLRLLPDDHGLIPLLDDTLRASCLDLQREALAVKRQQGVVGFVARTT